MLTVLEYIVEKNEMCENGLYQFVPDSVYFIVVYHRGPKLISLSDGIFHYWLPPRFTLSSARLQSITGTLATLQQWIAALSRPCGRMGEGWRALRNAQKKMYSWRSIYDVNCRPHYSTHYTPICVCTTVHVYVTISFH